MNGTFRLYQILMEIYRRVVVGSVYVCHFYGIMGHENRTQYTLGIVTPGVLHSFSHNDSVSNNNLVPECAISLTPYAGVVQEIVPIPPRHISPYEKVHLVHLHHLERV